MVMTLSFLCKTNGQTTSHFLKTWFDENCFAAGLRQTLVNPPPAGKPPGRDVPPDTNTFTLSLSCAAGGECGRSGSAREAGTTKAATSIAAATRTVHFVRFTMVDSPFS